MSQKTKEVVIKDQVGKTEPRIEEIHQRQTDVWPWRSQQLSLEQFDSTRKRVRG